MSFACGCSRWPCILQPSFLSVYPVEALLIGLPERLPDLNIKKIITMATFLELRPNMGVIFLRVPFLVLNETRRKIPFRGLLKMQNTR